MSQERIVDRPELPSNRKFGWTFALIFAAGAAYALFKANVPWSVVLLVGAGLIALVTLLAPHRLASFNRAWFELGILLGKIVSPIVLGAIFFILLTPIAVIGRLAGRDALALKRRGASSYWVDRPADEPSPDSFRQQF